MIKRRLKVVLLGVAMFLIAYLSIAALWADSVAEELLRATPSANRQIEIQPEHLAALIRIEDPDFHTHHGLSISNGQGLTTITSVVARDLFLGGKDLDGLKGGFQAVYRAVFKCCKRIDLGRDMMAVVLGFHATKQQQLNLFVNNAYWGAMNGRAVIGLEAAAKAYYAKDVLDLTDDEFYGLIAMPMSPNFYHPIANPALHDERARRIMKVVTGQCAPSGWLDLTYDHCDGRGSSKLTGSGWSAPDSSDKAPKAHTLGD